MAVQSRKRLTDSKLRNITPNSNQLTSSSVAGLVFKPSPCTKGTGAWILRYYDKVSKKRTKITLGHYPKMGIAAAEEEAKFLRAALKQGVNPKVEKQKAQDRERQKQLNTFKSISEEFFNKEKIMKCWKNQKSIDHWSDRMKKYIYPALADKPIIEINARDLTAILIAIWNTKTETANRVLYQIKQVFNWANLMGYCNHNPYEATKTVLGNAKSFTSG
jgi:hypothetical protein